MPMDSNGTPFCLTYHIKGWCNMECSYAVNHIAHTSLQNLLEHYINHANPEGFTRNYELILLIYSEVYLFGHGSKNSVQYGISNTLLWVFVSLIQKPHVCMLDCHATSYLH